MFFGSKMGQTKSKPLRVRYFLRFFTRNCSLHLEHLKKNTRNRILLCNPNNQIIKLIFSVRLLWMMYCSWCLDYTGSWKIKFKNVLNSQKWSIYCKEKIFEMFLKTFDWKLILKFCVKIICGSHFNRPSGISCEKYDEKCHDQLYFSILVNVCN